MKPEETVDFHIRWVWNNIAKLYNAEATKFGGSMSIGYTLLNIDKKGTPSTRLAPKMGMEPRSLTRTLKTMEEQGLIYKKQDPVDKRLVLIFLTSKGVKFRKTSKKVVIQFNEYLKSHIPEENLNAMITTLNQISRLLENNNIFEGSKGIGDG